MDLKELDCYSRRGVLRALAGVGVTTIAAGVLTACGGGSAGSGAGSGSAGGPTAGDVTDGAGTDGAGTDGAGTGADDAGEADGASAGASVPLADVPVGEAVVVDVDGTRVVVARPSEAAVVAFSANCTHAGTVVQAVGGLELRCPNHGSRFDAGDGAAVVNGPAQDPLPSVPAAIEGDLVVLSV